MKEMKKKKTNKKQIKSNKSVYKVFLKNANRVFEAEGENLEEALRNIKIPSMIVGASLLIVQKGNKVKEAIIPKNQALAFAQVGEIMKEIKLKSILQRVSL